MVVFDFLMNVLIYGTPVLFAITLHEAAHGYVALACGDPTAKMMGRLSLNPLRHIDPFGTVLLPLMTMIFAGFTFGYAKPVPVNFNGLRNPRFDALWVALAGPVANFMLALLSGLLMHSLVLFQGVWHGIFKDMFEFSLLFNLFIGFFNLTPILPLDGGRIFGALLPPALSRHWARHEPYGFFVVITFFFLLPWALRPLGIDFNPFQYILKNIVIHASNWVLYLTGH